MMNAALGLRCVSKHLSRGVLELICGYVRFTIARRHILANSRMQNTEQQVTHLKPEPKGWCKEVRQLGVVAPTGERRNSTKRKTF